MRRSVCLSLTKALAIVTLLTLSQTTNAEALRFTGNVDTDFPVVPGSGVVQIIDNPVNGVSSPGDVTGGAQTGFNIRDLRLFYDEPTDTMAIGLQFFGIAGDADGDGNPGGQMGSPAGQPGGIFGDQPSLGGRESIVVGFDFDFNGQPDVVAGVPVAKPFGLNRGIDAFTVARFRNVNSGLGMSFGETLTDHVGIVAFDPSPAMPDFIFTIENFKGLPGLDVDEGFIISAFAGSDVDVSAGEDHLVFGEPIPFPSAGQQQIPEPSTILAWTALAGVALVWQRRRARRT